MASCTMTGPCLKPRSTLTSNLQSRQNVRAVSRRQRTTTRALSDTNLVISGFVFLDFQRDNAARQGMPVQNGITHEEAGDRLAGEVPFLKATKDPAGFNIIDVFAWGAIGHALGYAALAIISLNSAGINPAPKF